MIYVCFKLKLLQRNEGLCREDFVVYDWFTITFLVKNSKNDERGFKCK